jgi:DNA-binding CsgD family transcriptional regulator
MRGWALAAIGNWDEVLAESLRAVYAPTQPGRVLATQAVAVLVGRGSPQAEPLLTRLRGTGDRYAEIQLDLCEIDLRLAQGRPADAVTVARSGRAGLEFDSWGTERLLLAARHAAALADLAQADRLIGGDGGPHVEEAVRLAIDAEGRPAIPSLSGPYGRSWLLRLRAEADRAADADTAQQWELVRREARSSGRIQEQVYAAIQAGRLLLVDGDRDSAARLLRGALDQARQLGATPMVAAIEGLAARGRLRLAADRLVQSIESPLTAREHEVLVLVARGLSNRRIGEALFISDKTASVHLSHIMAKLGAATRTEAVSLARQRGLLDH